MEGIPKFGRIGGLDELAPVPATFMPEGKGFSRALKDAIRALDELQKDSESAQASFARGEEIELHDVMIKIEEAEIAFRSMMEVRNKLLDAYRDIMRMGSGG